MSSELAEKISWRDPSGFVVRKNERIYRAVSSNKVESLKKLLNSSWYQKKTAAGWFPRSEWIEGNIEGIADSAKFTWLEHQALGFPCYPHEITALQLYDAAKLTLAIAKEALAHDLVLKDASAWNILFDNGKPTFCDILSFEPRDNSGIWIAYAQFHRHFVIPLLLHKECGVQTSWLYLIYRDGVPPEQARRMIKGPRAYLQPALEAVTLPAILAGMGCSNHNVDTSQKKKQRQPRPELARYLLERTFKRLEKHIDALKPKQSTRQTKWENYEKNRPHYSNADISIKQDFIRSVIESSSAKTVLDLGCNAGEFSKIAASLGRRVLAADYDHGALTRLYTELRQTDQSITPMMLDVSRPTPAVGWMNTETPSFIERAKGKFDCIMALGLIHHLLVSERVTLQKIFEFIHALNPKILIIEWIAPQDPRFDEIAGLNRQLYMDITETQFESTFSPAYRIVKHQILPSGTRKLYFFECKFPST